MERINPVLSDTSPEAEKVQLDLLRKMTVAQRLGLMRSLTRTVVHLSRDSLARLHPGLDDRRLDLLWVEQQYGRDLALRLQDYLDRMPLCKTTTS
jgi:hypothetical protein